MILSRIIAGINILSPYYDGGDGYHLGAKHYEIFLYATSCPVSPEDIKELLELGWFQPDGANEDDPGAYNQEEPWVAYV